MNTHSRYKALDKGICTGHWIWAIDELEGEERKAAEHMFILINDLYARGGVEGVKNTWAILSESWKVAYGMNPPQWVARINVLLSNLISGSQIDNIRDNVAGVVPGVRIFEARNI